MYFWSRSPCPTCGRCLSLSYLPGRGLSDAQSGVVQHLREVRELCRTANPSRMELQRGHGPADLVGGITFALDLSQGEILSLLDELGAEPSLQHLIHALHHRSKYRLHSQGDHQDVETTTGIKQGSKLAPTLFSVLTGRPAPPRQRRRVVFLHSRHRSAYATKSLLKRASSPAQACRAFGMNCM